MKRLPSSWLGACAVLLGASGCAHDANITSSQLPLKRVVVYRNGVGYFERAGRVESDEVRFKMKTQMVGDFLATLAIIERGGSSVRSASFPLDLEEEEAAEPEPPPPYEMLKPYPPPTPEPTDDPDLKNVVLTLDGRRHDLVVGYVAETPVWRPSYRLVVHEDGSADLQAWGIVQNLSGEDWEKVKLVLVAGAPLAFESTLGDPVIPPRPVVTDQGEVIAAVPQGLTSLEEKTEAEADEPAPEPEEVADEEAGEGYAFGDDGVDYDRRGLKKDKAKRKPRKTGSRSRGPMAPPPPPAAGGGFAGVPGTGAASLSQPRNLASLAAVAMSGGNTRYVIPKAVTIPDESATMVLLISRKVPGEAMFLFAPDGGVPDSASHPFRVARFENATKGLLERGPIAVFEEGSFLGQGMVDPLPPDAAATVPFALERSLAVQNKTESDTTGSRLFKVESGRLWIERDNVRKTIYTVKNGSGELAKVLVKHYRMGGARLENPPPGTKDEVGQGHALVPVEVKAHGKSDLVVDERTPSRYSVGWTSTLAATAVEAFLKEKKGTPKQLEQLEKVWQLRARLKQAEDEHRKLDIERNELERSSRQDRLKLKALEKNRFAIELKQMLTKRMTENTKRIEQVEKRIVEVAMTLEEARIRFEDSLKGLSIPAPKEGSAK